MEFITLKNAVIFIFVLTYLMVMLFYGKKTYFIWAGIIAILALGVLSPSEAFASINWNVMGIYVGMLFISEVFIYSKLPDFLAEKIVSKSRSIWVAMLGVCLLSGFISIVVENVAVVLIIAPIALFIAKRLKISAVPLIIGIAVSSNLQGVATMIGDPPSLLLADHARLNFNDFFFFQGKPGLFFAVQIAALFSLFVLYLFFRKYNKDTAKITPEKIRSHVPGYILLFMIASLAITSLFRYSGSSAFLNVLDHYKAGIVCMFFGLISWIWYHTKEKKDSIPMIKRLDWDTGLFIAGIFIMVQALINVNFMKTIAKYIISLTGNNILFAFTLIVVSSVILSGFVDNVPFIAAMLPVVTNLSIYLSTQPYLFYFGLVIGASVGGNITPIGAAANVVGMGILKKEGYRASFWDFVKIGLPFTIVSVLASSIFIWFFFS
jgi:Na+/H+ antiporter NhaD/arsenite permease-like protein